MQKGFVSFCDASAAASEKFRSDKNVALITTDGDYLFAGKEIKDELTMQGFAVSSLAFDDGFLDTAVFESLTSGINGNVVVVGNSLFLNAARAVLKNGDSRVLLVATDLNFFSVISDYATVTRHNRLTVERLPQFATVIDPKIVSKLKKTAVMQGFLEIVAKLCYLADYVNSRLLKNLDIDESFINGLLQVICSLKKLNGDYAKSVIAVVNAQYLLAEFSKKYDEALFAEETFIGDVLASLTSQSLYSCQYAVFCPLIELYTLVLQKDLIRNSSMAPDYCANIAKLSELKKADKIALLYNYRPLDAREIQSAYPENTARALSYYKKFKECFVQLESRVGYLFGGRKKICKFTVGDMQNAFCLSGYQQATDFFKIINDSGVLDCFE
ncbi:MAG: hypothetical protein ACI4M6_03575 [Christensenellaceae bacterium]